MSVALKSYYLSINEFILYSVLTVTYVINWVESDFFILQKGR